MIQNIALLQMNVKLGDPDYNFQHALSLMESALTHSEKPTILVLPETFNTGFYPHESLYTIADKNGEQTKTLFQEFAKKHDVHIVAGSVTTLEQDALYNTSYTFNRYGELVNEYHKIHSFSPAGEDKLYSHGTEYSTFYLDDWCCATTICYDLRFPELYRSLLLQGTELFFLPAQWPTKRLYAWNILTKARAIENQSYLCAVNGCGLVDQNTKYGNFGGHSVLCDPMGEIITNAEIKETITFGSIDKDYLKKIRLSMNILDDRKPDVYSI